GADPLSSDRRKCPSRWRARGIVNPAQRGHDPAVTGELAVGSVFAGHRTEGQIGERGMGIVYLAQHLRLNRNVALKVVRPEMSTNAEFRERFAQEARLAAAIDHPNIIPRYDAG